MTDTQTKSNNFATARRRRIENNLRMLDAIERAVEAHELDVDPLPDWASEWSYSEHAELLGVSDDERRAHALAWLARHAKAVAVIAREMGHDEPIAKVADDMHFGVEAWITAADGLMDRLRAVVPSSTTCEMVDTGEVEHIPAREVPVLERICPPSIFAGIEQEAI